MRKSLYLAYCVIQETWSSNGSRIAYGGFHYHDAFNCNEMFSFPNKRRRNNNKTWIDLNRLLIWHNRDQWDDSLLIGKFIRNEKLILSLAFDSRLPHCQHWRMEQRKREWMWTLCFACCFFFHYIRIGSNTLDLPKLVDCPWYFALYSSYMFQRYSCCVCIFFIRCALNYVFMSFLSHSSLLVYQNVCVCVFFVFLECKKKEQQKKHNNQNGTQKKFCVGCFGRDIFIKDCCVVTSSLIFRSSFWLNRLGFS